MEDRKQGFTLIELLIIFTIIALLMVISFGAYKAQLLKGYDGRRKADISKIKVALEEHEKDHECYPTALPACNPGTGLQPYLNKIPCDARTKLDYVYYVESGVSCPKWYWIFTTLDNTSDPAITKLGCESGCGPNATHATYNYYDGSPNAGKPFFINP